MELSLNRFSSSYPMLHFLGFHKDICSGMDVGCAILSEMVLFILFIFGAAEVR